MAKEKKEKEQKIGWLQKRLLKKQLKKAKKINEKNPQKQKMIEAIESSKELFHIESPNNPDTEITKQELEKMKTEDLILLFEEVINEMEKII